MSLVVTPYEGHRWRVREMEAMLAKRLRIPIVDARDSLARATKLTPAQLENIAKGKPKDLYGGVMRRIDMVFVALARKAIRDLEHDVALAVAHARGIDPDVVAEAQASLDALEQLMAEARAAGVAPRDASAAAGESEGSC